MTLTPKQSAEFYLHLARKSAKANNSLAARMAYFMSIQSWKTAAQGLPSLATNLANTEREYIRFIHADSKYREMLKEILSVVADVPGIHEGALLAALSHFPETDVKYTLYFAVKDGQLQSIKREAGYEFYLPTADQKVMALSLFNLLREKFSLN